MTILHLMVRGSGVRDIAEVKRVSIGKVCALKELRVRSTRIANSHWDSFVTAFKYYK